MPRLTYQEQQEIIRFIEADKPLPEKYRFLLFEEKREAELNWNEKTGGLCHIVLPSLMPKGRRDILWGFCLNGIRTRNG
ncbi:MAG: adenine-specific DNA-methyltransferase [Thermodesulfobacteriota bacterium]|nr:adenine-specific DNA-methyltransferase [Thermodesulfobacteriota bacterium]